MVVGGLFSTVDVTNVPLRDQTFLFYGAGMASLGCAELLVNALRRDGLTDAQARARIWMMDSKGLLVASRPRSDFIAQKLPFVRDGPVRLRGGWRRPIRVDAAATGLA